MAPTVPINDVAYRGLVHAEPTAYFLLENSSGVEATDLADMFRGKTRPPMPLSLRRPIFLGAISHVCGLIAKKQMGGPEAARRIALVANEHACGDLSVGDFVGHSMGKSDIGAMARRKADPPVPMSIFGSGPKQAFIAFWDGAKHFVKQFVAGNLVSHRCTLHWCASMASLALERYGAFPILPNNLSIKGQF